MQLDKDSPDVVPAATGDMEMWKGQRLHGQRREWWYVTGLGCPLERLWSDQGQPPVGNPIKTCRRSIILNSNSKIYEVITLQCCLDWLWLLRASCPRDASSSSIVYGSRASPCCHVPSPPCSWKQNPPWEGISFASFQVLDYPSQSPAVLWIIFKFKSSVSVNLAHELCSNLYCNGKGSMAWKEPFHK